MTARAALFQRIGLQVDEAELEALIDAALAAFLPAEAPHGNRSALGAQEVVALEEAGLSFERRAVGAESPLVRTAAEYAALIGAALSVPQAAERLAVEPSRVRQRLAERTLYGVKQKAGWRLPLFQFTDHGTVPNVEVVAPRLFGLHPVAVARWFTAPHVDLVVGENDQRISPRAWLETGRDPGRVVALADELHGPT